MQTNHAPTIKPAFYSTEEARQLLNVGKSLFNEMLIDGRLAVRPIKAGRKNLFPRQELEQWIEASKQEGRFIHFDKWQSCREV